MALFKYTDIVGKARWISPGETGGIDTISAEGIDPMFNCYMDLSTGGGHASDRWGDIASSLNTRFYIMWGATIENAIGADGRDKITGNELNNYLAGKGSTDSLWGDGGNDVLDGGSGNDILYGGTGDDRFIVDSELDSVVEYAGEGDDWVQASSNYTLSANVEKLELTGTANLNGTGNDGANLLIGNAGANVLSGGLGADVLQGGAGNDTYVLVDADTIVEYANGGTDTVISSMTSTKLGNNLENLTLAGGGFGQIGEGNALGNTITGNDSINVLYGRDGNDVLRGGGGGDVLVGGAGWDQLYGGTGRDTFLVELGDFGDWIYDFTAGEDLIALSQIDANATLAGVQAFTSLVTKFTGVAGQLRVTGQSMGDGALYQTTFAGDVNGDKVADFSISLMGEKPDYLYAQISWFC